MVTGIMVVAGFGSVINANVQVASIDGPNAYLVPPPRAVPDT